MKNVLIIVGLILVAFVVWRLLMSSTKPETTTPDTTTPEVQTPTNPELSGDYCTDLKTTYATSSNAHMVAEIMPGDTLSSPYTISGCVYADEMGDYDNWAPFEGQIGHYELRASDNSLLDSGPLPVIMTTDWMADAMAGIPLRFENITTFNPVAYTSGTLTIFNENASGEPIRDRQQTTPVNF